MEFAKAVSASAQSVPPLQSRLVGERYGVVLVPNASQDSDASSPTEDLVAERQREGWHLVSSRVDSEGSEIVVFRRPA